MNRKVAEALSYTYNLLTMCKRMQSDNPFISLKRILNGVNVTELMLFYEIGFRKISKRG